jgi:hypothetical protein
MEEADWTSVLYQSKLLTKCPNKFRVCHSIRVENFLSVPCLGQPCKGLTDARSFHTTWASTSCLGKPLNHAVNFRISGKKIQILGRNEFNNFSFSRCLQGERLPRHTQRLQSQYSSFWRLLQIWASTKDLVSGGRRNNNEWWESSSY